MLADKNKSVIIKFGDAQILLILSDSSAQFRLIIKLWKKIKDG